MDFIQRDKFILKKDHDCLLIPFFNDTNIANQLKQLSLDDTVIKFIIQNKERYVKQTTLLPFESGYISIKLMDLGNESDFTLEHLSNLFKCFGKSADADYQILLSELNVKNFSKQHVAETIIKAMFVGAYTFSKENLNMASTSRIFSIRELLKDEKKNLKFTLISIEDLKDGIKRAVNYGKCINYARVLGDIPNNYLHVKQFAEYAEDLANEYNLSYEILNSENLKSLHSGGILGVNAGSNEEAKLITIYYEGNKGEPIIALIGKGVMFDSGGYNLKSMDAMDGMKYDMCGAANVFSVLEIAVRQKIRKNILVVIPVVENLIGPSACKMGDVLTTMSGKTVEIYNTDAEGRLILCDAITYAIKNGAKSIIDLATLTYSCKIALGNEISGIFSNNDEFCNSFIRKTEEQCENVWRLPLHKIYHKPLYRTVTADLINYAPKNGGGASVAACFLEEFVEKNIPWIHLDIVGTSVKRNESKIQSMGATGVLISSISAFLESM